MNHPLVPEKCKRFTSSGLIYFLLLLFLSTALTVDASACNAVITVVKNGNTIEDQNPDFCEGGAIKLTAWVKLPSGDRIGAASYKWNTGETSKDIVVDQEGRYEVIVEDASGCKATAFVDVTKRVQAQKPTVYVNGNPTFGTVEVCDDRNVKLTVNQESDVAYVWEKDGVDIPGAGNTNEYTIDGPGSYSVRASNSCGSVRSDPVKIKITAAPETPVIEASGPLEFCQGTSVKLSVTKVDGAKYKWMRNGQQFTPLDTAEVATDLSGVYTVEVRNTCGASVSSKGVTVKVLQLITPKAEDVKVCIDNRATLRATGGTAGSYRWYTSKDDDTPDPSRRDDTYVTQILTQDVTFYVAVFNGACEGDRVPIKVSVSSPRETNKPTITVNGPTKFCGSGEVTLRVPRTSGVEYQWIKDGVNFGQPGEANELVAKESGEYTVILLDACGNIEAENRVVVDVLPLPEPPIVKDTYSCNPSAFTLMAAGGADGEYRWYNSQKNPTSFFGEYGSTYTTTYLEENTTYWVSIKRGDCESERVPVRAVISGPPVADAGPDVVINPGESVRLQGSGDGSYEWSPVNGLNDQNSANPVASPMKTTTYTLKVSRGADCVGTDEVTVIVREPLDIPNVFSPNGDGTNDTWEIENIHTYPDARIEIFNRWGSKVFDKIGYENDWNGTYRGSPLPVGAYFYVISLHGGHKMTGSVSIVH